MTAEKLKTRSARDLAQMAKRKGVNGWHGMTKDQLVRALVRLARTAPPRTTSSRTATVRPGSSTRTGSSNGKANGKVVAPKAKSASRVAVSRKPTSDPRVLQRLTRLKSAQGRSKNLAFQGTGKNRHGATRDRLVVMVRDPYWLHAYWELTRQSVERAEAAMGDQWHTAKPVLRVLQVYGNTTTSSSETVVRNIEIHGGVNNWYVDVNDPPKNYRLEVGYLAHGGRFYCLARSNVVSTPRAGASDALDENWTDVAENFEKIYAMSAGSNGGCSTELQELFEERLRRPMGSPMMTRFGLALDGSGRKFDFEVDAELIVFGRTEPGARVTLQGDPVKLRPDGTFTVRYSLPNCRQVIPAVASSVDGAEQRTVVLAVERNTKVMEPLVRDADE